jgi:hypothetical protein
LQEVASLFYHDDRLLRSALRGQISVCIKAESVALSKLFLKLDNVGDCIPLPEAKDSPSAIKDFRNIACADVTTDPQVVLRYGKSLTHQTLPIVVTGSGVFNPENNQTELKCTWVPRTDLQEFVELSEFHILLGSEVERCIPTSNGSSPAVTISGKSIHLHPPYIANVPVVLQLQSQGCTSFFDVQLKFVIHQQTLSGVRVSEEIGDRQNELTQDSKVSSGLYAFRFTLLNVDASTM